MEETGVFQGMNYHMIYTNMKFGVFITDKNKNK